MCGYFHPLLITTSVVSHLIAFPQGMVPPPPPPTSGAFPLPPKGALLPTPLFAGTYIINVLVQCVPLYSYANKPVYPCISSCVRINYSWISSCVSTVYPCISSCISISLYIQLCLYIQLYQYILVYLAVYV